MASENKKVFICYRIEDKEEDMIGVHETLEGALSQCEQELFELLFEEYENEELHDTFVKKYGPDSAPELKYVERLRRRFMFLQEEALEIYGVDIGYETHILRL